MASRRDYPNSGRQSTRGTHVRDPMNNKEWQQAIDAAAKQLDNEAARRNGP
jgi:hypothetical protein